MTDICSDFRNISHLFFEDFVRKPDEGFQVFLSKITEDDRKTPEDIHQQIEVLFKGQKKCYQK